MKIYIDSDCKCYATAGEDLREFEVPFFDGKCPEFIEGYRYIPSGELWTRADGERFRGEIISSWKPDNELEKAQLEYELAQLKAEKEDMQAALDLLGVNDNE